VPHLERAARGFAGGGEGLGEDGLEVLAVIFASRGLMSWVTIFQ